ncbi:hypothetical protein GW17_00053548 [Ensete ventricosum]|nr:hypothetical protein GW17_00053548 [Ensete ventricosum]
MVAAPAAWPRARRCNRPPSSDCPCGLAAGLRRPLAGWPWSQPAAPLKGALPQSIAPLHGGLGYSRPPLQGGWPWPYPVAPCRDSFAMKMQQECVERFYAIQSHHTEIVYPYIPDPDGEDEGGQASSSLAISIRWISVVKLPQSDLATLAQR